MRKINTALDIDGVLCDFAHGVIKRAGTMGLADHFPTSPSEISHWNICDKFSEVMKDAWMSPKFWLDLPAMTSIPKELNVVCYVTARPIDGEVTRKWLEKNGFPPASVITVSTPEQKLEQVENLDIEVFVDDLYSTVKEFRDNGINALLMKAPYQAGHKEECSGLPTIDSLEEVRLYV